MPVDAGLFGTLAILLQTEAGERGFQNERSPRTAALALWFGRTRTAPGSKGAPPFQPNSPRLSSSYSLAAIYLRRGVGSVCRPLGRQ